MRNGNVTVSYDEEKLNALKIYLELKNKTIEKELAVATDTLYVKHVPSGVRAFIDMRAGGKKPTDKTQM